MRQAHRYYVGRALFVVPTVVLFGLETVMLLEEFTTWENLLFGLIAPVVLLCTLAYMAVWMRNRPTTDGDVLVLGLWFVCGALVFWLAALATFLYQVRVGGQVVALGTALTNWAIGGAALGLLAGNRDIRQRLTQRELRTARQRASILNRVLRHDIRNGLTVIFGYLDLIEPVTAEDRRALETVRTRAEHLHDVAERARLIEKAAEDRHRSAVDIADVVRSHTARLASDHPDAHIETTVTESAWAIANAAIAPALWEPLENAVVHNDRSSAHVEVEVTTPDGQVVVRIADDGPGLPELEEVVFRDDVESQLVHSRGTGLWFLKIVAEESRGHIEVADAEGDGTVVTVRLPRASEPPTA